jgi:hypothetical protein
MANYNKFESFVEAVAEKKHDLGSDTITVALSDSAPEATDALLTDISEITYTNLSARDITTTSSAQTSGTYKLVLADKTLTASGEVGPFRYVVLYNDDAANDELIGWYDYGSSITLNNGDTFTLDFDGSDGVIQIA